MPLMEAKTFIEYHSCTAVLHGRDSGKTYLVWPCSGSLDADDMLGTSSPGGEDGVSISPSQGQGGLLLRLRPALAPRVFTVSSACDAKWAEETISTRPQKPFWSKRDFSTPPLRSGRWNLKTTQS